MSDLTDLHLSYTDCQVLVRHWPRTPTLQTLHYLRGALGRVLAKSASEEAKREEPCPFDPPCGYDLFHNSQGKIDGRDIPKPFVLRLDHEGAISRVTLRLFGRADRWRHGMQQALIAACRRELGGRSLTVVGARLDRGDAGGLVPQSGQFELITPLVLRTPRVEALRQGSVIDVGEIADGLFDTLALRGRGLLAWCGEDNARGWGKGQSALRGRLTACDFSRGEKRPRIGLVGTIHYANANETARVLLGLARTMHGGADTVIGAGRIRMLDVCGPCTKD